jgi:hypothetical protein
MLNEEGCGECLLPLFGSPRATDATMSTVLVVVVARRVGAIGSVNLPHPSPCISLLWRAR